MTGCPPYEERVELPRGADWSFQLRYRVDAILSDSLLPGPFGVLGGLRVDSAEVQIPAGRVDLSVGTVRDGG